MPPTGVERRRFSTDEYHRLAEVGLLAEDDRVELLAGEIWEAAAVGSQHIACVLRLNRWFSQRVGELSLVSIQNPLLLDDHSEPEPDVALLRPRADFYATDKPRPRDVLLVVEVCDASWSFDRRVKLPLYAAAGIVEVWLVHLEGRAVHIHRRPEKGRFMESLVASGDELLSPTALPSVALVAGDLFG